MTTNNKKPTKKSTKSNGPALITVAEIVQQFATAIEDQGYVGDVPADGQWHAIAAPDDLAGKKSSSALLRLEPQIKGLVKNYYDNSVVFEWKPDGAATRLSDEEKTAAKQRRETAAADLAARQEEARITAVRLWSSAKDEGVLDHPYIRNRHPHMIPQSDRSQDIAPIRLAGDELIVPMFNVGNGELQAVERITPSGDKFFLKDSKTAGCCFVIGDRRGVDRLKKAGHYGRTVILTEGVATGFAVNVALGGREPVVVCFSIGNIKTVIEMLQRHYALKVIVAADNDLATAAAGKGNPGVDKANKIAESTCHVAVAVPPIAGDFADLIKPENGGPAAVAEVIRAAIVKVNMPVPARPGWAASQNLPARVPPTGRRPSTTGAVELTVPAPPAEAVETPAGAGHFDKGEAEITHTEPSGEASESEPAPEIKLNGASDPADGESEPDDGSAGDGPPPADPEPDDGPLSVDSDDKQAMRALLDRMNEQFCVLPFGSNGRILTFEKTPQDHREMAKLFHPNDFTFLHDKYKIWTPGKKENDPPTAVGRGKWWLSHQNRRQHRGVIFMPNQKKVVQGYLNLWRGFAVTPKEGNWSLLREHVFNVLANRNQKMFDYIIYWTAFLYQHPEVPAETVLVFIGEEGVGKGVWGRTLCRSFGQHGLQISSSNQLVGKFNAHLMDCVFLFADEALWPGERSMEGTLNRIITEGTLTIEKKGEDTVQVPNHLHIVMCSNADWVVPASKDGRRYAPNHVNPEFKGNPEYWNALYYEINHDGLEAMMFDLIHMDIGDWHPRIGVPQTEALAEQKHLSLRDEDQYWFAMLQNGELPQQVASFYPDAIQFHQNIVRRASTASLREQAGNLVPRMKGWSETRFIRILKSHDCKNVKIDIPWCNAVKSPNGISTGERLKSQLRGWEFPPLAEARQAWDDRLNIQHEWESTSTGDWVFPADVM